MQKQVVIVKSSLGNTLHKIGHNVSQLQEVGDFYHKCSYEELHFKYKINFHMKHRTANFL